ncbi:MULTISPECIES: hypothetical protein [unclassified Coleofasciculus]|uniref:hypothetical protein n=1 Tax=unclassified Coleofasciculus TaxID=2692782 RepID=UPI00187E67F5|nr:MULTISPECIES: hypothetical protein [unclassified Coleofasciculus]MBE9129511.1 hypothetical protein [Coleofasciculus sp. LEGE 07081]MBE9151869.1 hypothetical protein [Coleofasciculus sp. LEGE 07092]
MTTPRDTYLQDPDEQMDGLGRISSEPVQADDREEAEEKCEDLADSYGMVLEGVSQRADDWYDCNFRG